MLKKLARYYFEVLNLMSSHIGNKFIDLGKNRSLTTDLGIFGVNLESIIVNDKISFKIKPCSYNTITEEFNSDEYEEVDGYNIRNDNEDENNNITFEHASKIILNIYKQQELDKYNRDIIIGFPLLSGKVNNKSFCAPIFFNKVKVDYNLSDNLITLIKDYQSPSLNIQIIKFLVESDEDLAVIKKHILPDLIEDFDLKKIISNISKLVGGLNNLKEIECKYDEGLAKALNLKKENDVYCINTAVIFSTAKTNAYLIDDLLSLIDSEEDGKGTIIDVIISENNNGYHDVGRENKNNLDSNIILFPLLSNNAQKKCAEKAKNSKMFVIQGPPGTGKSQTIANLVSHLIANEKKVLVVSHQNKALEVVSHFLPKIDYFAMTLLKDDKESLNEIRNKIESIHAYVCSVDLEKDKKLIDCLKGQLHEINENIKKLEVRFNELRDLQNKEFSQFKRYYDIRDYNVIHRDDNYEKLDKSLVSRLHDFYESFKEVKDFYIKYDVSLNYRQEKLGLIIENLKTFHKYGQWIRNDVFNENFNVELFKRLLDGVEDFEGFKNDIDLLIAWLNSNGEKFVQIKKELGIEAYRYLKRMSKNILHNNLKIMMNILIDCEQKLRQLSSIDEEIGTLKRLGFNRLKEVEEKVIFLKEAYKSFFKWYFSKRVKKSKLFLYEYGFTQIKRNKKHIEKMLNWYFYWFNIYDVTKKLNKLSEYGIGSKIDSDNVDLNYLFQKFTVSKDNVNLLNMIKEVSNLKIYENKVEVAEYIDKIREINDFQVFLERLTTLKNYIIYLNKIKEIKALIYNFGEKIFIKKLIDSYEKLIFYKNYDNDLDSLNDFIKRIELYAKVKNYETHDLKDLKNTLMQLKNKVVKNQEVKAFESYENILEARRLSDFIKNNLLENPDDTDEVSERIKKLQVDYREKILEIIKMSRKVSLKEAESDKNCLFNINKLSMLLRKKRKTESLVQLKNNIDFKSILNVFPCWVTNIDDVPRIFPLEKGLFDYLIVDEASQCNQATILTLAYRAKRMIVVGDSKQMKNPNTQFLSDHLINLSLSKNGLDSHPKSIFFNCRNSLLDLALGCQDTSPVFLNEHFRCEPPIIKFSNMNFYNNQLAILTPIRKKRFSPCMEIKYVTGAYDTPDDKKVNELEAIALVEELKRMLDEGELEGESEGHKLTVGILSLFRKQAILLQDLVYEAFAPHILKEHMITVSTVDGFQGDERDVILYSFRYAPNSKPGMITALQMCNEHSLGRLNVAFSRAKRKVVCFISTPISNFPQGIIRRYLEHVMEVQNSNYDRLGVLGERAKCQSKFERDVYDALVNVGLDVYTQVPCAGFFIDLVVIDKEGRRIAIECDGDFHYDEFGLLREEDLQRQEIIERSGWYVQRVSSRKFYSNSDGEIKKIISLLERQDRDYKINTEKVEKKVDIKDEIKEQVETEKISNLEINILNFIYNNGETYAWQIRDCFRLDLDNLIIILNSLKERGWLIKRKSEENIIAWEINSEKLFDIERILTGK